MDLTEEITREVSENSRAEFIASHRSHYLLLARDTSGSEQWSFKTKPVALDEKDQAAEPPKQAREFYVFALFKTIDNTWRERISVGRARNNDIVIPDNSVSKLHAYFICKDDGAVEITDAGSRNGTRHQGQALHGEKPVALSSGDQIIFGAIPVSFVDSAAVYDYVSHRLADG